MWAWSHQWWHQTPHFHPGFHPTNLGAVGSQTHVYVPPYESKPDQTMYGSRYVVAVMRASDTVYYACRDIHATDWEVHPVAVPDSNGTDGDA